MPAYQPPPAARSLASRPIFWILPVLGIPAVIAFLAAAGFAGYSKVIKGVKARQEEVRQRIEQRVKQFEEEKSLALRAEPKEQQVDPIVVNIARDGSVEVNHQILNDDQLAQRFKDIFALNPEQPLSSAPMRRLFTDVNAKVLTNLILAICGFVNR
jgi:hypothetical protein